MYTRLKDLREDNDLTQKEIAEKLSMQTTQYRRYESGERTLPLDITVAIAKYYNVSIDYIAGMTNEKKQDTILNKEDEKIISRWKVLSERNKGKVDYLIEQLQEEQAKAKEVI